MTQKPLIMIIDDDVNNIGLIADILEKSGFELSAATDSRQAMDMILNISPDLILLDIMMPGMSGLELCKILKGQNRSLAEKYECFGIAAEIPIIFQTAKTEIRDIVKGFDAGAVDYISKPFNTAELLARVKTHVDLKLTRKNLQNTQGELKETKERFRNSIIGISDVIAVSEKMKKVVDKAYKLHNARDIPVLIEGETGTGKEVVARIIHYGDGNVTRPFVDVNSAVIPKNIFESELFGYEPGAFTGADKKGKTGYFGMAQQGTIFLDEIGELPLDMQPKLLRVLQEGYYYKLGSTMKNGLDARILSATNRNLEKLIREDGFRADLFHRLGVGYIHIPPLRERVEDIMPLAEGVLERISKKNSRPVKKLSSQVVKMIQEYHWPGNVRELENVLRLADFLASDNVIEAEHIEFRTKLYCLEHNDYGDVLNRSLFNIEIPDTPFDLNEFNNRIIEKCLEKFDNSSAKVANFLGVSRQTIYRFQKKRN